MAAPLLLTAFEPFTTRDGQRLTHNPTIDVVDAVAASWPSARGLVTATLPCAYARTRPRLLELFDQHEPRAWLGLGVAMRRQTIDLERIALNVEHCVGADNDGTRAAGGPISPGAPLALEVGLDVRTLAARLAADGLPTTVSHNAGTFLCNQALWTGCERAAAGLAPGRAAFVHIPPLEVVPLETTARAVFAILAELDQLRS